MTISETLNELKISNDAMFLTADLSKKGCFGLQLTNEHKTCEGCELLGECRDKSQARLSQASTSLEMEMKAEMSLGKLDIEHAAYLNLAATPDEEPDDDEQELEIELPDVSPVRAIATDKDAKPAKPTKEEKAAAKAAAKAAKVAEKAAAAATGETSGKKQPPKELIGFNWAGTIQKLMTEKPATIKAAALIIRVDLKAVGFKPNYFSHFTYYSNKVLNGLVKAGKATVDFKADSIIWN